MRSKCKRLPAAVLLFLAGCNELPAIEYETDRLWIGVDAEAPLCAGTLHELDRQVQFVEETLNFQVADKLELYLFEDEAGVAKWCERQVPGCYSHTKKQAYATLRYARHELVHAATGQIHASADTFLDEGFAVDLAGDGLKFPDTYPSSNLGLLPGAVSYPTAGHFMRWLRSRYSSSELKGVFRQSRRGSVGQSLAAFTKAAGDDFVDVEQVYLEASPEYFVPFDIVAPPTVAPKGGGWDIILQFDCERVDTEGYNDEMWRRVRIEVSSPGRYVLVVTPPATATITLRRSENVQVGEPIPSRPWWPIGDDLFEPPEPWLPNWPIETWLDVGFYDVEVHVPGVSPAIAAVRIHPQLGPSSELP